MIEPKDSAPEKYYGKYRGFVVNNVDIERRGRVTVMVPNLGTGLLLCAEPCFPATGLPGFASGMFAVPAIGAGVFVEFIGGEIDQPIWSGGFPGTTASMPVDNTAAAPGLEPLTIQSGAMKVTVANHQIEIGTAGGPGSALLNGISITPGSITFMVGGASFVLTPAGIDLNKATITLVGAG
ncbi:MAG: phage baseplate assembly protein V [Myxococcota bacterium]